MKFGGAKQLVLAGYDGEKVRVRLASNTLSSLDADPGDVFMLFYSDSSKKRQGFDIFARASLRGVNFRFVKCYNKLIWIWSGSAFPNHGHPREGPPALPAGGGPSIIESFLGARHERQV